MPLKSSFVCSGPSHWRNQRWRPVGQLLRRALLGLLATSSVLQLQALEAGGFGNETQRPDSIIATPWDIRREAQELLVDLQEQRSEMTSLMDRTHALLRKHGEALISYKGGWLPVAEAVRQHLETTGLADNYRQHFDTIAKRELEEILTPGSGRMQELPNLAREYPGTAAAKQAWRLVVDRAWDHGKIGDYLTWAEQAEEHLDPIRKQRVTAARSLLIPAPVEELPANLDTPKPMWNIDGLPNNQPKQATREERPRLRRFDQGEEEKPPVVSSFAFSRRSGSTVAATDGHRLVLFDPLIGTRIGDPVRLGNSSTTTGALAPDHHDGIFVALAISSNNAPELVAVNGRGMEMWRHKDSNLTDTRSVSRPVIVQDAAVFAYTRFRNSYAEVHASAHDLHTGRLLWRKLIAKGQNNQRQHWYGFGNSYPPDICTHDGNLIICSNGGLLAQVTPAGQIRRIWTYQSGQIDPLQAGNRTPSPRSQSALLSDGNLVVASPRDTRTILILDPRSDHFAAYTGQGCRDILTDCDSGKALLVGERVTQLDLPQAQADWSFRCGITPRSVDGIFGKNRCVAVVDGHMFLISRTDGNRISARGINKDHRLTIADGIVVTAGPDPASPNNQKIIGYGDEQGFERLLAKSRSNPDDYRPLLALASLYQARGQVLEAYRHIVAALGKGAPGHNAITAGRLVRSQLARNLGGEAFNKRLALLQELERYEPDLAGERLWWQARQAEITQQSDDASRYYLEILSLDNRRLPYSDGLKGDLHALARSGLHRLDRGEAPPWMLAIKRPVQPHLPGGSHSIDGRQALQSFLETPLVSGDQIIGYRGGRLVAEPTDDAEQKRGWKRQVLPDDSPMLGVYINNPGDGSVPLTIGVIPGSAAAASGLRSGDTMIELDGQALADFRQLTNAVGAGGVGGAFTMKVKRTQDDGSTVEVICRGRYGSSLWRPVAATEDLVINRSISVDRLRNGWATRADTDNPIIEAIDRHDGRVLWQKHLKHGNQGVTIPDPLLASERILVMTDGSDLLAYDLRKGQHDKTLWRRPGKGDSMTRLEVINERMLLVTHPDYTSIQLLDNISGRTLFDIPADPNGPVVVHNNLCFVRDKSGNLNCWNLGTGSFVWRSEDSHLEPLAIKSNGLYVRDRRRQLKLLSTHNGRELRHFNDWTTVYDATFDDERLYVHARKANGNNILAAIAMRSNSLSWEQILPYHLELSGRIFTCQDGIGCLLDAIDQAPSVLAIARDGSVTAAMQLREGDDLLTNGNRILIHSQNGVRSPTALTSIEPQLLVCPKVALQEDLAKTAIKAMAQSTWLKCSGGQFAIAKSAGQLLVIMKLERDSAGMDIRLGDAGPIIDHNGQLLRYTPGRPPIFKKGAGGWKHERIIQFQDAKGEWYSVAQLSEPIVRQPGTALVIRADGLDDKQEPGLPWWYRPSWYYVDW